MYDGMSLFRAVVISSDSVSGDINVLIPSVLGATETVPITKLGRESNSDGSWPVPAVGDQVVVAVEDDRFSNVYIVVTDLPEQVPDGVLSVTGTPDQVLVNTAGQHVTLYLPQSISPSSNVVFGNVTATSASAGTLNTPNLTAGTANVTTANATTVNAGTSNTSGTTTTNGLAVTSGTITTPASTANLFTGSTLVNVGSSTSTVTLGNDLIVTGDLIVSGTTTSTSATTVTGGTIFTSNTISTTPVSIVGFSGQTANLTEWKTSAGTVIAKVSAAGVIDGSFTGSGAGLTGIEWANIASKPSPTITLGNHATGSVTLNSLTSGTLNVTVVNDSHTHDTRYYTETESDSRFFNVTGDSISGVLTSTVATGTAPFTLASTSLVTNLNADLLDGQHGAYYRDWTNITNKPSPVITLGEDASGSVTLTNVGSATLNVTVLDDSHLHDSRYYTETESDLRFLNVAGDTMTGVLSSSVATGTAPLSVTSTTVNTNFNADLLDGQHGAYYRDWTNITNKPSPTITLGEDASGSVTLTNVGSATLNVTVLDDSHLHDGRYYTETEADARFLNVAGDTMTGVLTSTVSGGVAPFVVASNAVVTNLNADLLDGQQGSWYQDWANITNKPDPVVTLAGDVDGTATMTDLGSITINTTIQPNSVTLGTDTVGKYARTLTGTANRITVTAPNLDDATDYTLNLPQDIHTGASPQFASARLLNTTNTNVVLTVQGEASQVADLQHWKTPTTVLAKVDTGGKATFKEVYVDTSTTGNTYRIGMLSGTPGSTVDPSKLYIVADSGNANTTPSHASVTTPFYADSNGRFSIGDSMFFDPSDGQSFGRLTVIGRIRGAIENTPIVPTDSGQFTVDQVGISGTSPNQTAVLRTTIQHTFNVGDTVVIAGLTGNGAAANGAWQITAKTTVSPFTFTIGGISGATNGTYAVTGTARVREMTFGLHAPLNGSPAGLGIRLDESNYWFVNNRFRVGTTGSYMEWNGTDLTLSGRVVAQSGDFQGALTVNSGTMKIGKDAGGSGLHGVHVNANNYWYDNGAFRIGGTTGITYLGSGKVAIGSNVDITGSAFVSGSITSADIFSGTAVGGVYPFRVTTAGVLTASSGTVGGWTLGTSTLTGGNTTLSSGGDITVGTGNQVVRVSSTDAGFRFWAGNSVGASAPFSISTTGAIKATSGTVGGWTLSATTLSGGSTTLNSNGSMTVGTNFGVSTTGVLTASNAVISGDITATTGSFTGRVTVSGTMYIGTGVNGAANGIYIGTSTDHLYSTGQFQFGGANGITYTGTGNVLIGTGVTINGNLSSVTGSIGGFTIGSGQLTAGTGSTGVGVATGATTGGYAFWAGNTVPASASYYVTNAGALFANNANIRGAITATSGDFQGALTVNGGTMKLGKAVGALSEDGIHIDGNNYWYSTGKFNVGGVNGIAYSGAGSNVTVGTNVNISGQIVGGSISLNSGTFSVTSAGLVTATSGSIGGWNLGTSTLTGGSTTLNSNGSITAGSNFSVSTTGVLTAANAVISGQITAASGNIGGFTIDPDQLYAGSGSTRVGVAPSKGGYAFWAGANTPASASFNVTSAGQLTANNAAITGSVTANSFTLKNGASTVGTLSLTNIPTIAGGTTSGSALTFYHQLPGITESFLAWTTDTSTPYPTVALFGPKLTSNTYGANGPGYLSITASSPGDATIRLLAPKAASEASLFQMNYEGFFMSDYDASFSMSTGSGANLDYTNYGGLVINSFNSVLRVKEVVSSLPVDRSWIKLGRAAQSWATELRSHQALAIRSTNNTITHTVPDTQTHNFVVDATTRASVTGSGLTVTGTVAATTFSGSGASLTSIPNSATTATSANTINAIVARDSTGAFIAGAVTVSSITSSGNITFPLVTDVGLRNTTGTAYFHLDRSSGNAQWKSKGGATAYIDADTLTVRNNLGATTYASFTSTGVSTPGVTLSGSGRRGSLQVARGKVTASAATGPSTASTPTSLSTSVDLVLKAGDSVIINANFDVTIDVGNTGAVFVGSLQVNTVAQTGQAIHSVTATSTGGSRSTVSQSWLYTAASDGTYTFRLMGQFATAVVANWTTNTQHTGFVYQVFSDD